MIFQITEIDNKIFKKLKKSVSIVFVNDYTVLKSQK
jgi:hypothetical protein